MSPSRPASSIAKHAPVQGYMRVRVRVRVRVCMYERKRVNVCESVCESEPRCAGPTPFRSHTSTQHISRFKCIRVVLQGVNPGIHLGGVARRGRHAIHIVHFRSSPGVAGATSLHEKGLAIHDPEVVGNLHHSTHHAWQSMLPGSGGGMPQGRRAGTTNAALPKGQD